MAFSFDIKGLDSVQRAMKEKPDEIEAAIKKVLVQEVTEINKAQVALAQKSMDRGGVVSGLTWMPDGELNYKLISQAPHSAYIEFGTGKRFQAIPDVDASQYRGSRGKKSGLSLFEAIYEWVRRKGIADGATFSVRTRKRLGGKAAVKKDRQVAYLIYRSILKNGIRRQPFFFTPFLSRRKQILDEVDAAIKKIL